MIQMTTALILLLIAAIHMAWGFGVTWPEADGRALARRVAGFKGITRMPGPASCFAVGIALAAAALILLEPIPLPAALRLLTLSLLATVFAFRGVLAYHPRWRALTPELPFAQLDRRFYGPLCLVIALGLSLIIIQTFGAAI